MAMYAVATRDIIDSLKRAAEVAQVWFADDSQSAGLLVELKKWWDHLCEIGPKYGYFPKASKTHLVVKNQEMHAIATELFDGSGIKITCEGKRQMGAAIGTNILSCKKLRDGSTM